MILDYITQIKANIAIYTNKKTSNILDGTYKSVYKGKSMNFEDLRAYVIGDNVKDIDWKASARSGTLLIRQYIAEKKHNIILVIDSSPKMLGHTQNIETKKNVALMSAGTLGYLATKNGDYVATIYNKDDTISYYPFKSSMYNLEKVLSSYEKDVRTNENSPNIEKILEYIYKYINRKSIIFVVTDLDGIHCISEDILKKLTLSHDVLFVNIDDADMTNNMAFDMDESSYIPRMIFQDNKLQNLEKQIKNKLYKDCVEKLKSKNIQITTINSVKEITNKIIELLERHKYANHS